MATALVIEASAISRMNRWPGAAAVWIGSSVLRKSGDVSSFGWTLRKIVLPAGSDADSRIAHFRKSRLSLMADWQRSASCSNVAGLSGQRRMRAATERLESHHLARLQGDDRLEHRPHIFLLDELLQELRAHDEALGLHARQALCRVDVVLRVRRVASCRTQRKRNSTSARWESMSPSESNASATCWPLTNACRWCCPGRARRRSRQCGRWRRDRARRRPISRCGHAWIRGRG